MRSLWYAFWVLLTAAAANGQVSINFEQPPYNATPNGVLLTGQDGWINPVAGTDYLVQTYAGNLFAFPTNPTGGQQFIVGRNGGAGLARAQRNQNFATADTWTISWDTAVKFTGATPAAQPIATFTLENASSSRTFTAAQSWVNPNGPTQWNAGYQVFTAAGAAIPFPGLFPGPQWQNLQANRWYRQSTTLSFSTNQIIEVSLTDIVTQATFTVRPIGWFLAGGANPALPLPSALRFTTGGTTAGNTAAWDNVVLCPFQVNGFTPPQGQEGGIIQITGCGFGTNPDNLSVAVMQGAAAGIPLTVLSTTNTLITARLGPVPNGAPPGTIMVARGQGSRNPLVPALDDVIPEDQAGTLVWNRQLDPRKANSSTLFVPLFSPPPTGTQWFFGQLIPGGGQMRLTVNGNILPNTSLRVIGKLHNQAQRIGADVESVGIRLRCGGDAQYLAERIRDVIQAAYSSHGINTLCDITVTGPNQRDLAVSLLDGTMSPIPLDFGVLDVCTQVPILINPFAIGPVTAFFNATLTNTAGTAVIGNIGSSGEDGATISPFLPTTTGVRNDTELIPLLLTGESLTTRAWGNANGQANQLLGAARLLRGATTTSVVADFTPIGSTQVRIDLYYNTALKSSTTLPNGTIAQVAAGPSGEPRITGCGVRPQVGATEMFLWIDLDRPALITPTGGVAALATQIRVFGQSAGGLVQSIQAFDIAAGLLGPQDASTVSILSSVEGGICYANCDGSSTPPILNINDFICFNNLFASGDLAANCDGSETPPVLNVNDFSCFLNAYAAGCP